MTRLAALVVLAGCATAPSTITAATSVTADIGPLPTYVAPADVSAPAVRLNPPTTPAPPVTVAGYVYPDANVQRWYATAIEAGWFTADWPWLSCVIHRESRGDPNVIYIASRDRSYGLVQINARAHHTAMVAYAGSEQAFLDPLVNLSFARLLYDQAGKAPWRASDGSCRL